MAAEAAERGPRETARRRVARLVQAREEVLREQLDVLGALAQGRQPDREHAQAVEQVLAQLAVADGHRRLDVARGDDAHVDRHVALAADAGHAAGLEHAQQPDLQLRRHLADLVEEERPADRALEEAAMCALGAREAARARGRRARSR
jgi:hypothetical protein